MKKLMFWVAPFLCMLLLSSCLVSKKKYDEQVALANKYLADKNDCGDKLTQATATIDDLNKQIANLNDEIQKLKDSNASSLDKIKKLEALKAETESICEKLKQKLETLTLVIPKP